MPPTEAAMAPQAVTAERMKPNPRNNATMFRIFENVQHNVVQHKKYAKEMTKLYKQLDQDTFRESFKNALYYLFTFGDTSANVDRVIQFVATFCTKLDEEEEFLLYVFDIIFESQCASGQSVRYRASQLLAAVLSAMGDDACLDDDLCDRLLASQMERLQDTRSAVRCRAALALQRLQAPPEDEVTRAYRFHMSCDPSSSVRRAILMSIAKTRHNVPFVLERLLDPDEPVRRAAFLYMAAMPVTQLKVTQRIMTLKIGLTERVPHVRRVVEEILVPGWLSAFKGNIIDLLKAIRLDNSVDAKDSQYVAGKLLESLFKRLPISELLEWLPTDKNLRVIPAEKLNKETAWYWRHLAVHLQAVGDDETLETLLPDLVVLTGYIRAIVESPCPPQSTDPVGFLTRQSVVCELGRMLQVYDAADPAGRDAVQQLVTDTLTGDYGPLNYDVIHALVSALEMVVPDVSRRMEMVSGVLSALRDAPEQEPEHVPAPAQVLDLAKIKLERARLRVSLNVAIEAQEEAVQDQNYALAAECKAKVEDIQRKLEELVDKPPTPPPPAAPKDKISDAETLNKCLTILNCALDTNQLTCVTPMLRMIFKELEEEIFQNQELLQNALETVALYGMLDKEFAKENKAFFFVNLVDTSNEPIVSTVLRCVVDLLCVHGARVFEDGDAAVGALDSTVMSRRTTTHTMDLDDASLSESLMSLSPAHSTVIELLLKIMDSTCAAYRLIIVEGLCRLLYLGRLESPSILSRLLLLWFNPATEDEDMLRQTIGVFFQTFPTSVDGAQEQIQKATIPTLRALGNAPSNSPLAEVDQEAVIRFIVSLTRVNYELVDSQGGMALTLTAWLSRRCGSGAGGAAGLGCRLLALLSPPRDARLASQLAATLRDVALKLQDKQASRNLTRYLGALEAFERQSLNKMSTTAITEGTLHAEDTLTQFGRTTTSLPQPIARSTHVVINETVEEVSEIDESSPTDLVSKISDIRRDPTVDRIADENGKSGRISSSSEGSSATEPDPVDIPTDSSSGVSPVKKAKVVKGKKKLSLSKKSSTESEKERGELEDGQSKKGKKMKESEKGGVKRTRSQRSLVDDETALKSKPEATTSKTQKPSSPKQTSPLQDLDVSNVTIRKSIRGNQAPSSEINGAKKTIKGKKGKPANKDTKPKPSIRVTRSSVGSRSSQGSHDSMFSDSADETELHTIVYDNELEQSLLNDSDELSTSKRESKGNVTIPETPEGSDESDSEIFREPVASKSKKNGRKK